MMSLFVLLVAFVQDPAPLKAGFAEVEITPPTGTRKIGWNNRNTGEKILDPLFARAAVFEAGSGRAAFVSLDLLFVHRGEVAAIRKRFQEQTGFPGDSVMV